MEERGWVREGKRCRVLLGLIRRLWVVGATEGSGLCKINKIHNLPRGSFVQDAQRIYHNMVLWYIDGRAPGKCPKNWTDNFWDMLCKPLLGGAFAFVYR